MWWTGRIISIIAENKLYAHHKMHLHTMKVYNTRPVYSLTIKSIHLFQGNQTFQATEFVDQPVPEKLDIFHIDVS